MAKSDALRLKALEVSARVHLMLTARAVFMERHHVLIAFASTAAVQYMSIVIRNTRRRPRVRRRMWTLLHQNTVQAGGGRRGWQPAK
jgi:hypothetical protein